MSIKVAPKDAKWADAKKKAVNSLKEMARRKVVKPEMCDCGKPDCEECCANPLLNK